LFSRQFFSHHESVQKHSLTFCSDLIYDYAMLEELDLLAKRVQKLVAHVRTLSEESAGLRQKLDQLQLERDELFAKAQSESDQVSALKASLGTAEIEAAQTRTKAQEDRATLQGTLDLFRQENQGIQAALKTREEEVSRLRQVNEQARKRIDGVLERLPGANMQETD
jgi:chromosome segregation ATPase